MKEVIVGLLILPFVPVLAVYIILSMIGTVTLQVFKERKL